MNSLDCLDMQVNHN